MRTLALDLGTKTGWASIGSDGGILYGSALFQPGKFDGGGMRFLRFSRWIEDMHDACKMERIYFEAVRRHIGVDAAHVYGGFLSHLTAWAENKQIPYLGVPVQTIKKFITGKGNANKDEVIAAVKNRGFPVQNDNEADAVALALYVKCGDK